MSTSLYHRLRVAEIIEETHDSKSIVFAPPSQQQAFHYKPGQFLTLRIPLDGQHVARCYSLASSPTVDDALKVTIKRVDGGLGSNWICDHVKAGDTLEVLPPAGLFCPSSLDGDLLLFAGGSGITPVMSILKSSLHGGHGKVFLFYANRDERSVIFGDELRELAQAYPSRLTVVHWLASLQGNPTGEHVAAVSRAYLGGTAFICGPGPFMDTVEQTLLGLDMDPEQVHVERFVSLSSDPGILSTAAVASTTDIPAVELQAQLDGQQHVVGWSAEVDLLDALLLAGVPAPFSCREGRCSACMCRVDEGEVNMRSNEVLDAQDLAEGWVLACQARPASDRVKVSFDG